MQIAMEKSLMKGQDVRLPKGRYCRPRKGSWKYRSKMFPLILKVGRGPSGLILCKVKEEEKEDDNE
jgi:hypothetical protein